jgi:hypothetical protein
MDINVINQDNYYISIVKKKKKILNNDIQILTQNNNIEYYKLLSNYISIKKTITDITYLKLLSNLYVNAFNYNKYLYQIVWSSLFYYLNKEFNNNL